MILDIITNKYYKYYIGDVDSPDDRKLLDTALHCTMIPVRHTITIYSHVMIVYHL